MTQRDPPSARTIAERLAEPVQAGRLGTGPLRSTTGGDARRRWVPLLVVLLAIAALAGLAIATRYRYGFFREHFLLLHALGEAFSVVIALGIFALAWNSRRLLDNSYPLVIGVAYLCVGALDLLHTLAYKNMGIFAAEGGSNLATQLWVSARHVESVSLLVAPLLMTRRLQAHLLLAIYGLVTTALLLSIFRWKVFPTCFVEGQGLTLFKRINEYIICLALAASIGLVLWRRRHFDGAVLSLLVGSIAITVASELAFTLYTDPYGPANFWGHVMKVLSFYLIYRAVIYTGLVKPQDLLFHELKASQAALLEAKDSLEHRVEERTAELSQTLNVLEQEVHDRLQAQETLDRERRRLFSVLQLLPSYVCLRDKDHRLRFANDKFLELYGEPGSRPCYDLFRRRGEPCQHCPITQVLDTHTSVSLEWPRPDGRIFHVWAHPFVDHDGTELVLELGLEITEAKRLEAEVLRVSEAEKRHIGQDLHDSLGQVLSGAACLSQVLHRKLAARRIEEAQDAAKIESLLVESVELTRSLARGLNPIGLSPEGLMDAMEELASTVTSVFGTPCVFECDEPVLVHDAIVAKHLYRIAQEATNNAVRHGNARSVRIALASSNGALVLTVTDDGIGLPQPLAKTSGMGLRVMRHRAASIGASFQVRRRPEGGTTVTCRLERPTRKRDRYESA